MELTLPVRHYLNSGGQFQFKPPITNNLPPINFHLDVENFSFCTLLIYQTNGSTLQGFSQTLHSKSCITLCQATLNNFFLFYYSSHWTILRTCSIVESQTQLLLQTTQANPEPRNYSRCSNLMRNHKITTNHPSHPTPSPS